MADLSGHRNFHGPEPRRHQPDPVFPSQPRFSKSPPEQGGRTGLGQQSASARLFAGRLVDRRTIALAEELARRWNVPAHHVLLSTGWIRSDDYCRVVAREFDIAFAKDTHTLYGRSDLPAKTRLALKSGLMTGLQNGRINLAITPRALGLFDLNSLVRHAKARSYRVVIATPDVWIKAVIKLAGRRFTNNAIYGLMRSYPEFSASSGLSLAQIIFLSAFVAFGAALGVTAPKALAAVLMACLTLFFLLIASFRVVACLHLLAQPRRQRRRAPRFRPKESELPVYTVLVPLFRETEVLPHLIFALKRLNYPVAKLDIKLVIESADTDMQDALKSINLPANIEVITAPDSIPRTKPKALNFALHFARGDYVVIYDAEDLPEPDQILKALHAFREGPNNLACVQARLNFYNVQENWLTKQFAIEYSALFDGLLPALEELKVPIPLGGTSNHFRMSVLRGAGGWDAFNVTEDADLGMRVYRRGYCCKILDSTTYEEANCRTANWVKQRSRWIKGWMQTYLVHMRHPIRLGRELGMRGFIAFQAIIGGTVVSALAHPIFLVTLLTGAGSTFFWMPETVIALHIWVASLFNLIVGYAAPMALGYLASRRRGFKGLGVQMGLMPFYWLLISFAAYRAIWHWIVAPFHWEKTRHGLTRMKPQISAGVGHGCRPAGARDPAPPEDFGRSRRAERFGLRP